MCIRDRDKKVRQEIQVQQVLKVQQDPKVHKDHKVQVVVKDHQDQQVKALPMQTLEYGLVVPTVSLYHLAPQNISAS